MFRVLSLFIFVYSTFPSNSQKDKPVDITGVWQTDSIQIGLKTHYPDKTNIEVFFRNKKYCTSTTSSLTHYKKSKNNMNICSPCCRYAYKLDGYFLILKEMVTPGINKSYYETRTYSIINLSKEKMIRSSKDTSGKFNRIEYLSRLR